MTQESDIGQAETQDESSVIKAMRKQISDLESELKARPDRETVEASIRSQLERENAIANQLVDLGHPRGMSTVLTNLVGEDVEVNQETVSSALQSLGYQVEVGEAPSESESKTSETNPELAEVASLSGQVATAASGDSRVDLTDRINQAQTPEELASVMAEAGLTADYTP